MSAPAKITREKLIEFLNEDLAREYQAIIAYTVYSNVLTGAQWMNIAGELKKHASEELDHAMIIACCSSSPACFLSSPAMFIHCAPESTLL